MENNFSYISTYDYSSPSSTSTYYYPTCPYHSSPMFYSTPTPSMYSYYEPMSQIPIVSPPMNPPIVSKPIDRTPLRRHRCFKKNELQILHIAFSRDPHPTTDVLQQLAEQLKSPIEKVRQWFKNRRHSEKQKQRSSIRTSSG